MTKFMIYSDNNETVKAIFFHYHTFHMTPESKLVNIACDPVVMDEVVVIREVPPAAPLVQEVTV